MLSFAHLHSCQLVLYFHLTTVKHALQNTHQWLSRNFGVHQIQRQLVACDRDSGGRGLVHCNPPTS